MIREPSFRMVFSISKHQVVVATLAFGMGIGKQLRGLSFPLVFSKIHVDTTFLLLKPLSSPESKIRKMSWLFRMNVLKYPLKKICWAKFVWVDGHYREDLKIFLPFPRYFYTTCNFPTGYSIFSHF